MMPPEVDRFQESSSEEPAEVRPDPKRMDRLLGVWEVLSNAGLAETALRLGTHVLLIALILGVAWGLREFYLFADVVELPGGAAFAAAIPTPTPTQALPDLPDYYDPAQARSGITRFTHPHTDVPSRGRAGVLIYTVKNGDTLFGIADKFGLTPETVIWANQTTLNDNPHNLRPGQSLTILPVDGIYHRWSTGDSLVGVARFFGVTPDDIIAFPGNELSYVGVGDLDNLDIEPGVWLVIPGGRRDFVSWSAPEIPLDDPEVARVLGPGACETVSDGAIGSAAFAWPADQHFLSGFDFTPSVNHHGIDIAGEEGAPVYAADSGVVVYAGWNEWGYGNVVVINHGNGWQTLYAHLSEYYVGCGQSVVQGSVIAAIGSTGAATNSHLHFEMMFEGANLNPHDYLP
jgi:murein DD-endopeptidase MepM/ murein hydrolase activator NlpD